MSERGTAAVIVPVKGENPKERLSPILSPLQRRQLKVAMLEDTLQTLIKAGMVGDTFVVSSDRQILDFVPRFGARSIAEPADAGVSSAVSRALAETSGFELRLVVPGDLPLLSVEDLRTSLALAGEGADLVIGPSESFDGTNLLLLGRGVELPLHYDDDSFRKHFREAVSRGLKVAVYRAPGVAFDIDSPADVQRFFAHRRTGSTLTLLGRTLKRAQSQRQRGR
ncbi:MAG: 2-phospho-L-lactate guanylyltransferase [Nitrososphaerota archaeon]|nr:2-phospho-L-lactate guanylyltransferase [Nitrososphaerota archaeon]